MIKFYKINYRLTAVFGLAILLSLISCKKSEDASIKPEDNRFTKVVLTEGMDEPMEMTFLPQKKSCWWRERAVSRFLMRKPGK